jgi:hypothetical protein
VKDLTDIQRSVASLLKAIERFEEVLTDFDPDGTRIDIPLVVKDCDKALNASGYAFRDDLLIIHGIITKKLKETTK